MSKTPVNPGKLFIWQQPFKPVITIGPNVPAKSMHEGNGAVPKRKKVFFLGFNRLGDFLCTTPAISGFRKLNPDAFIIYIVQNASYCRVLEGNPDIDQVIYSEDLYYHGEQVLSEQWVQSLPVEIEEPATLYRFNIHEVCRVTPTVFNDHISSGFARVLQIPIDSVRPVVHLSEQELESARKLVKKPYIVLSMHAGSEVVATGGHLALKDWMFENWLRLARQLPSLGNFDIVAIGAETDQQVQSRYYRNLYGIPIKTVAALLQEAACVITVESGISHLCHAVDAPMVIIFSRYVSFPWAFPREAGCCRVIYKDPKVITPDEVLEAVKSVLKQKNILV